MGLVTNARAPETANDARGLWRMALVAVVAGVLTGVVGAAFWIGLGVASAWRDEVATWAHGIGAAGRDLQAAAAGAGLGVAFSAPFGGAMFTFEEVRRAFTVRLAVASLVACAAAQLVASAMLGFDPDFRVEPPARLGWEAILPVVALGAVLGLAGLAYNVVIVRLLDLMARVRAVPVEARAAVVGAIVGAVLWVGPLLVGGGDVLTQRILDGRLTLEALTVVLVVRFLLGPVSHSAGTPGGLFAPLLLLGAAAGSALALAWNAVAPGMALDPTALAIVGMSTFFAAVVRAPFTGLLLIVEMTATTTQVIPMLAATGVAVAVTTALRSEPIYDTLRRRLVAATGPEPAATRR